MAYIIVTHLDLIVLIDSMPRNGEKRKGNTPNKRKFKVARSSRHEDAEDGNVNNVRNTRSSRSRSPVLNREEEEMQTEVNFVEGGNSIEITVHGQYSDFADEEEGEITEANPNQQNEQDPEITFRGQQNANENASRRAVSLRQNVQEIEKDLNKASTEIISMSEVKSMIEQSQKETANLLSQQFVNLQRKQEEFFNKQQTNDGGKGVGNKRKSSGEINTDHALSETTVYTNAVRNGMNDLNDTTAEVLRNGISSDEGEKLMDTSDESNEENLTERVSPGTESNNNAILQFIAASRAAFEKNEDQHRSQIRNAQMEPQPSTSRPRDRMQEGMFNPKHRANQLIKDAETAKARILDVPGMNLSSEFMKSALMDETFLLVASHLDQTTHEKIINGEYVDFARLIPRDRVLSEDDNRMQLVMRGNQSFWVPISQSEATAINSFGKWEQAFRVFSDVYTRVHPERASELVQYNHVIHTASMAYVWDNVYSYDKEFRLHLSRNPTRSWALLLQQAWSLRLKDRLRFENNITPERNNSGGGGCKRFNWGRCTYGANCRYEHRCFYCGKIGHGVVACRQLKFDRNDRNSDRRGERRDGNNGNNGNHGRDYGGRDNNNHRNNFRDFSKDKPSNSAPSNNNMKEHADK